MVCGVVAVAVAARISAAIPGSEVPQSAQTLAVLLVGALLGAGRGGISLALYLAVGAAGLPVFVDGEAGWAHLVGPTAGYLIGFVAGGAGVGALATRGLLRGPVRGFGAMLAGHVVILGAGWMRLAAALGAGDAFAQGVAPFLWGGVVKSVLGAAIVWAVRSRGPVPGRIIQ